MLGPNLGSLLYGDVSVMDSLVLRKGYCFLTTSMMHIKNIKDSNKHRLYSIIIGINYCYYVILS